MAQIIPPTDCLFTAGTWTDTLNANHYFYKRRTAAAAAFTIVIPLLILQNSAKLKGTMLNSVDIFFKVDNAGCTALEATLYKAVLPADSAAFAAGVVVPTTYDVGHDTLAERQQVDEHTLTLTLTSPAWLDDDDLYFVELVATAAVPTVFDLFAARANYTLRV